MKKLITWGVIAALVIISLWLYLPKEEPQAEDCITVTEDMTIRQGNKIKAKCEELISMNVEQWNALEEQQQALSKQNDGYRETLAQSVFMVAPQQEQAKLPQSKKLAKTKNLHLVK